MEEIVESKETQRYDKGSLVRYRARLFANSAIHSPRLASAKLFPKEEALFTRSTRRLVKRIVAFRVDTRPDNNLYKVSSRRRYSIRRGAPTNPVSPFSKLYFNRPGDRLGLCYRLPRSSGVMINYGLQDARAGKELRWHLSFVKLSPRGLSGRAL